MDFQNPELLSAVAVWATFLVALCALGQLRATKIEARSSTARQIDKDYLALAIQHPEFSSASYPKNNPRLHTFSNDTLIYERYEFYAAYLLFAAEGILESCSDDE